MKLRFWMMMALACIGGALASELVVRCAVCRDILGRFSGARPSRRAGASTRDL